mgnify:FL=1
MSSLPQYLSSGAQAVGDFVKKSPETIPQLGSAVATPFSPLLGSALGAIGIGTGAYNANARDKEYADIAARYDAIQRKEPYERFTVPGAEPSGSRGGRQSGLPHVGAYQAPGDTGRGSPSSTPGWGPKETTKGPKPLTLEERSRLSRGPSSTAAEWAKAGIPLVGQGLQTYQQDRLDKRRSLDEALRPPPQMMLKSGGQGGLSMADLARLIAAFKAAGGAGQGRTV